MVVVGVEVVVVLVLDVGGVDVVPLGWRVIILPLMRTGALVQRLGLVPSWWRVGAVAKALGWG